MAELGSSSPDLASVFAAERQRVELYIRNNADMFAGLLTDDFIYTSSAGKEVPQQPNLDNMRDEAVVMSSVVPSDEEVRLHVGAAVVTGILTVEESYHGKAFKGPARRTRTWMREGAGWKALAFQVTNVAEQ